jgi:glutamate formiminotransferase/formiminotetrahydrofolate cyclodeaminase
VKAIGWYIEEYGIAQISMNLTNISVTPVHVAFDEVCRKADNRGIRVTGSELVGLIPLKSLLDAGRYFLARQKRSLGVSDEELINIAVRSMGLSDIHPFRPEDKIIEFVMEKEDKQQKRLRSLNLYEYINLTASEAPAPGGGSASAYMGSLGTALGTMVANLSAHKKGWDERWEEFSILAEKGKTIQNELLKLVDEDTDAYSGIMQAFSLPKKSEQDKIIRKQAIQSATKHAILVPFRVMETAYTGFELIREMAEKGNPNSVTDAGVGALALRSCIRGAFLNVKINAVSLADRQFADDIISKGIQIETESKAKEDEILKIVYSKIDKT